MLVFWTAHPNADPSNVFPLRRSQGSRSHLLWLLGRQDLGIRGHQQSAGLTALVPEENMPILGKKNRWHHHEHGSPLASVRANVFSFIHLIYLARMDAGGQVIIVRESSQNACLSLNGRGEIALFRIEWLCAYPAAGAEQTSVNPFPLPHVCLV